MTIRTVNLVDTMFMDQNSYCSLVPLGTPYRAIRKVWLFKVYAGEVVTPDVSYIEGAVDNDQYSTKYDLTQAGIDAGWSFVPPFDTQGNGLLASSMILCSDGGWPQEDNFNLSLFLPALWVCRSDLSPADVNNWVLSNTVTSADPGFTNEQFYFRDPSNNVADAIYFKTPALMVEMDYRCKPVLMSNATVLSHYEAGTSTEMDARFYPEVVSLDAEIPELDSEALQEAELAKFQAALVAGDVTFSNPFPEDVNPYLHFHSYVYLSQPGTPCDTYVDSYPVILAFNQDGTGAYLKDNTHTIEYFSAINSRLQHGMIFTLGGVS